MRASAPTINGWRNWMLEAAVGGGGGAAVTPGVAGGGGEAGVEVSAARTVTVIFIPALQ